MHVDVEEGELVGRDGHRSLLANANLILQAKYTNTHAHELPIARAVAAEVGGVKSESGSWQKQTQQIDASSLSDLAILTSANRG